MRTCTQITDLCHVCARLLARACVPTCTRDVTAKETKKTTPTRASRQGANELSYAIGERHRRAQQATGVVLFDDIEQLATVKRVCAIVFIATIAQFGDSLQLEE